MQSFAMRLKDELASKELTELEEKALLKGMLQVNASINFSTTGLYLDFKSKNEKTASKVYDLIYKYYHIEPTLLATKEVRLNKDDIYYTRLERNAFMVLNDLKVMQAKDDTTYSVKKELETEEERLSYLRGAFLACGSVNDPSSNTYHLEIQTFSSNVAYNVKDLMNVYDLNAKISKNRRGYIVYLKSAEKIGDFLKVLGSNDELFYFEDYIIKKDMQNSINRLMNCEIANEKKSIEAAKRQKEECEVVGKNYINLKKSLKEAIELRLNHPEDSLNDLAEVSLNEVGSQLTKSSLNHRFREIHELYLEVKKDEEND